MYGHMNVKFVLMGQPYFRENHRRTHGPGCRKWNKETSTWLDL